MKKRIRILPTLLALGPLAVGVFSGCSSRLDVGADDARIDAGDSGQVEASTPIDGGTSSQLSIANMLQATCAFPLPPYDGPAVPASCPCTRRPSPRQDAQCPIGNCTSITVTVGPAGGTVELPTSHEEAACGVTPKLIIPVNALASDVAITMTELNVSPPEGYVDSSPVYRIEPANLQLFLAAKFTVGASNTAASQDIHAYWSKEDLSGWELVPDSSYAGGYVLGSTTRLGLVFAGRLPSAAEIAGACP